MFWWKKKKKSGKTSTSRPLKSSLGTRRVSKLFPEIQLQVESWEQEIKAMKRLQRLQPLHCYVRARHSRSKQGNSTGSNKNKGCGITGGVIHSDKYCTLYTLYDRGIRDYCSFMCLEDCAAEQNKLLLSWQRTSLSETHAENQRLRGGTDGWQESSCIRSYLIWHFDIT